MNSSSYYPNLICSNITYATASNGTFVLGIVTAVIMFVGFIGNVLIIHAYSTFQLRARINIYMVTLGFLDNLLLLSTIFFYVIAYLQHRMMTLRGSQAYFSFYCYPICNICRSAIVYTLLLTNVDSFVAVALPFWHRRYWLLQKGQLKYMVVTVVLFAVLVNLPRCFELEIVKCSNIDEVIVQPKELRLQLPYYIGYHLIFSILFCSMGPLIMQAALTMFVRHKLIGGETAKLVREASRYRGRDCPHNDARGSKLNTAENKMVHMLLLLSAKSLLCLLLPTVVDVVEAVWTSTNFGSNTEFTALVQVGNFCVVVNSSINFFVYWCFSVKFRKVVFSYNVARTPSIHALMAENEEMHKNGIMLMLRQVVSIFVHEERTSLSRN